MSGDAAPSEETMHSALELASRAPSVHNSQPWRWKLAEHSVHLYLDRSRLLPALDPTGREVVISCGAALHHARIAFASAGWRGLVHRLPNPALPDHLASIEFRRIPSVDPAAVTLAAVAADRRTDRRPYRPEQVPAELLDSLRAAAAAEDCTLMLALDDLRRHELEGAFELAGSVRREQPEYVEEWAGWTTVRAGRPEDASVRSLPTEEPRGRRTPQREPDLGGEGEVAVPVLGDGAVMAVLATSGDSFESWLSAGEALSAVLLEAAKARMAACALSHVTQVGAARARVREKVLNGVGEPQLAVRVGWPVSPLGPVTPRRPLSESVERLLPPR